MSPVSRPADPVEGPGEESSDTDLLRAHVAGDPAAFGLLFARHRDRLWAVALRTTGDPEDAADGLQDGMVAAWRGARSFRGDSKVTTWLHRIVVNACLDRMRAARVRRAETLPDDLEEHARRGSLATSTGEESDPADLTVQAERRHSLLEALALLPADQRAALVLVDMEAYPVAEAAEILDCAVGTVKSRCSRGRARLAGLLTDLMSSAGAEAVGEAPGNRAPSAPVQPSSGPRAPPPEPV